MKKPSSIQGASASSDGSSRWLWFVVAGCAVVTLLGLLFTLVDRRAGPEENEVSPTAAAGSPGRSGRERINSGRFSLAAGLAPSAEEIVSNKIARFVQARGELARRMAEHFKVGVPEKYEQFFKLAESGDWEQLRVLLKELEKSPREEGELPLWQAVKETYYVVEQAQKWPAQRLLDYGQAVLGSLRPDMVYVGGTDPGRFIPTLLNETTDGGRHIVLTQNALADASYLQYVNFLYGEQLNGLTGEDSQRAFQEYLTDAQRRLQHDQQSPGEPSQLRRGEDIRVTENRVQVSGQVAVMAINEGLLNTLMQKNPELTFALEESFSLPSTYVNATPLGPIMELKAQNPQDALTPEKAAQALDYWRSTAQQLLDDPELSESSEARMAWSHMATAQANLFASRNLAGEAEQAYRIAAGLSPTTPEPVSQLAQLLARTGRAPEANQILDNFAAKNPSQAAKVEEEKKFLATLRNP